MHFFPKNLSVVSGAGKGFEEVGHRIGANWSEKGGLEGGTSPCHLPPPGGFSLPIVCLKTSVRIKKIKVAIPQTTRL